MVETDTTQSPSPKLEIQSIAQMARGSKENLMAISYSQRPKTPMRTYVVSTMLVSALCIPLGFGIFLMFHPDRASYTTSRLEGTRSFKTDEVLISGLKKVVPMHNASAGNNPTFGAPRAVEFNPATQAPLSTNVPPPIINHLPMQPQQYVPVTPRSTVYAPGAASAAVPFQATATPEPMQMPVFDAPQTAVPSTYAAMPQYQAQAYPVYQPTQGFRSTKDARLQMVTNR